jgi:hypothetical protein
VVLALAATSLVGWEHHRRVVREECAAGDRLVAETWNPRLRDAVGAAIRASTVPLADDVATHTLRVLDDWATAWIGAYREASEATRIRGVDTVATMNVRLACLERERQDMGALGGRVAQATARSRGTPSTRPSSSRGRRRAGSRTPPAWPRSPKRRVLERASSRSRS